MFQSNDLELAAIHKSTSINPFHYAPQLDQILVAAAKKEVDEEQNEKSFAIAKSNRKKISALIEGIGKINSMDNIVKTCANICGVQLAIINITAGKSLLYQYAWKRIHFIENKHFTCWHMRNAQSLVHLPMLFAGRLNQFFHYLASFSQIRVTTNLVEHGDHGTGLNIKSISTAIKLASKIWKKMTKHIEDHTVPKEVPAFARTLFVKQPGGGFTNAQVVKKTAETPAANGKGKKDGNEPKKKKQKRKASDISLKLGMFHIKQGVNATLALPEKGKLKDRICLDFCAHGKKCNYPQMLCKNSKHYTTWKNIPDKDKLVLLKHMSESKNLWLDAETFSKHKITLAPEFTHLLGDASGPKGKEATTTEST
jgi:hypothetical protein